MFYFYFCACVYLYGFVCHMCASPDEPEEGVRFHGTRATDSWDLPGVGAGSSERVTSALLTTELSPALFYLGLYKTGICLSIPRKSCWEDTLA